MIQPKIGQQTSIVQGNYVRKVDLSFWLVLPGARGRGEGERGGGWSERFSVEKQRVLIARRNIMLGWDLQSERASWALLLRSDS